jgi:acylphosphatase
MTDEARPPQIPTSARAHLRIHGRVQGVWYRASTERQGRALGLSGWVRNRPDGSVEALAEGPRDVVERLVAWCHDGPPAAHVTAVDVTWSEARGDLPGFAVRR